MGLFGNNMKKKAVIYCRVSSDKQVREGNGLDSQEKRCRDYAKYHDLEVAEVFRDAGISGGIMERPGIKALINYVSKGGYTVIFDDISRFARETVLHFSLKDILRATGNTLMCVSFKLEDTPDGKFIETIMAASAELERTKNKLQVCNRMKARMEMGYWTFDCPPGYIYVKAPSGGKILALDEPKASIVKEALEGFASNRFLTQSDVQEFLAFKRFCHKGEFKKVHPQQVKRLLIKPLYAGLIDYPSWGIHMITAQHPALISLKTYFKIQEKLGLRANKQFTRKCDNEDFPIRGFALCPECNKPYTASWSTGRSERYPYYRCNNKKCQLTKKSIRSDILEEIFSNALQHITPAVQITNLAKAITADVYNKRMGQQGVTLADSHKEVRKLDQQIQSATEKLITTSQAVQQALEKKIEELGAEKESIRHAIDNLTNTQIDFGTALDKVISFIENPYGAWVDGDLKKKMLVQRLVFVNPIVIHPSQPVGTANLSFPFKMLRDISDGKIRMVEAAGIEPASASPLPLALHA